MSIDDRGRKDGPGMAMPADNIVPLKGIKEQRGRYQAGPETTDNAKIDSSPFSIEAEEGFLGSCLQDPAVVAWAAEDALPQIFYVEFHREIWKQVQRLHARGIPVDTITLTDALRDAGKLEINGGVGAVTRLPNLIPTSANAEHYLNIIKRHAKQRESQATWRAFGEALHNWKLDDAVQFWPDVRETLDDEFAHLDAKPQFELMSASEVMAMPRPDWLLGGVLTEGALSVVFGKYGSGKSFLVLDWALSIATGRGWAGKPVKRGPVVYLAGEGLGGLGDRLRAWELRHGTIGDAPFHVVGKTPQLADAEEMQKIVALLRHMPEPPALIIIDTLARATAGLDENKELGQAVKGADRLREEFGAHVLLVHHSGKDETKGTRGDSKLPGAVDTIIEVSQNSDTGLATVSCGKQKDAKRFDSFQLRFETVNDHEGFEVSCVLIPTETLPPTAKRSPRGPQHEAAVLALMQAFGRPVIHTEVEKRFCADTGKSTGTFAIAWRKLKADHLIEDIGLGRWQIKTPLGECKV